MKKCMVLLMAASLFAGCSDNVPVSQPSVYAETAAPTETSHTEELEEAEEPEETDNGSPRYNDPNAVRDVEMSETRRYVYTDDKGENGCAPGEVTYFASIPVGDDMPGRIELIDINTDEHVGYMYDDGAASVSGDETAGDGVYSIKIKYDLDIDTDPDVSETWTRCYFALYTDSQGVRHTCQLPSFVNVQEHITHKEQEVWDEVQQRIADITSSVAYTSASTDKKEEMLLDELDKMAEEGLVYGHLTRTNNSPRNVVYKIVKGPTVIVPLEPCACGFGYDEEVCDDISSLIKD